MYTIYIDSWEISRNLFNILLLQSDFHLDDWWRIKQNGWRKWNRAHPFLNSRLIPLLTWYGINKKNALLNSNFQRYSSNKITHQGGRTSGFFVPCKLLSLAHCCYIGDISVIRRYYTQLTLFLFLQAFNQCGFFHLKLVFQFLSHLFCKLFFLTSQFCLHYIYSSCTYTEHFQ